MFDKATLILDGTRKVDFSKTMIFMTSNLGAVEMNFLIVSKLGFGKETSASEEGQIQCSAANRSSPAEVYAGVHEPHQ